MVSDPLEFDVDIKKVKDGTVRFKLFATNTGDETIEGWSFAFPSDYAVVRSRNADYSQIDGLTVFEPSSSRSELKAGRKKSFIFELDFGSDDVDQQDILSALSVLSVSTPAGTVAAPPPAGSAAEQDDTVPDEPVQQTASVQPPPPPAPAQDGGGLPDGIDVSVAVTGIWDNSFNMEITITNDSGRDIDGWALTFDLPAELNNLWRGEVTVDGDGILTVADAGWNSEIESGGSVYFGLSASVSDPSVDPADLELAFAPLQLDGDALAPPADWVPVADGSGQAPDPEPVPAPDFPPGISAEAVITNSWDSGYVIEITIANDGSEPVEAWDIAFALPGKMTEFWRSDISQGSDGYWHASNLDWNGAIAPGENSKFGFTMRSDGPVQTLEDAGFDFGAHAVEDGVIAMGSGQQADPADTGTGGGQAAPPAGDGTVIEVDASVSTAELQQIIDDAPEGATIQLAAGTFRVTETLMIERDDIALKGAGMGETVLMGVDDGDANGRLIYVSGEDKQAVGNLRQDVDAGQSTIVLDKGHPVSTGDKLYIRQASDAAFLDSIGSEEWRHDASIRNTVAEVVAVDGRQVTLRDPVGFDYQAGEAEVSIVDLVENVSLSDFTVTYDLGNPDHHDFTNQLSDRYYRSEAITLRGTFEAELKNIEAVNSASTAFHFRKALDLNAENLIANGAHNKGGGGNGYAFELEDVYSSTFSGLEDYYMRHGFTMGSWFSSGNNTAHIAFTNRDVNFHGGRDYNNTVIVDRSVTDNQDKSQTHTPAIINEHGGSWGAPTDTGSNSIRFTHVVASGAGTTDDEVHATDEGAYMETRAGEDTLVGAKGADTLVAGKGDDEMWGGAGPDTFVFALEGGKWTDVIHDFKVGEDHFELRSSLAITGLTTAELGYGDPTAETVVTFSDGSEVILVDMPVHTATDLF